MMMLNNAGVPAADSRMAWDRCLSDLDRHMHRERVPQAQAVDLPSTPEYAQLGDKLIQLEAGDEEYAAVADKFYAGPGMVPQDVTITGIYRDSHSSTTGQARLRAFEQQRQTTAKLRGDANVNLRYGWHGTSKHGVHGIILHGFGQPRRPKNGACYGTGVYLAPQNYSNLSAVYSDIDEKGEQQMVLCQVIMGVSELVQLGSEQFHPSSENFDTGVDDLVDPKRYIIWSTHMSSHILPQYVISFKPSKSWIERVEVCRTKHKLGSCAPFPSRTDNSFTQLPHAELNLGFGISSSGFVFRDGCAHKLTQKSRFKLPELRMSFPELFTLLQLELPPANLILLRQKYLSFKAGKMSRTCWARCVRVLVGDRKLVTAIKTLQGQVPKDLKEVKELEPECFPGQILSLPAVPCLKGKGGLWETSGSEVLS